MSVFGPIHVHAETTGGSGTNGTTGGSGTNGLTGGSGTNGTTGGGLTNPLGSTSDLPTLIQNVLNFLINPIGTAVITLMLVYVGFMFVTAQGNPEKVSTARTALLWTVVGALILLGAVAIEGIIKTTVGGL